MAKFTKQAIYDSFIKFLKDKPLGQITVKDIVDDCGINRKTFYYYFQDIYELVNDLFKSGIEIVKTRFSPDKLSWTEALNEIVAYICENKKIIQHVYKTIGYEKMESVFYETCLDYLPNFIKSSARDLLVEDEDVQMVTRYQAFAVSSMLTRWINDGMQEIPTSSFERFSKIMDGTTRCALENADSLNRNKK